MDRHTETTVLILGANGFIGSWLTEAILQNTAWRVVAFDQTDSYLRKLTSERLTVKLGDIFTDDGWLAAAVAAADTVLPLAGVAKPSFYIEHPLATFELDFEQNLKIVRLCADAGKRVIFPSTSEVYGISDGTPLLEDESNLTVGPISKQRWIYSSSKQLLDRVIAALGSERGLDYTLFRPFNWVGPRLDRREDASIGQARSITQIFYDALERGRVSLVAGGKSRRSFLWVGDAMAALLAIIENKDAAASGQIFNIGAPENNASIRELAMMIIKGMGEFPAFAESAARTELIDIPAETFYGPGYQDTPDRRPSVEKIARLLGWQPSTDLPTMVRETLAYYAKEVTT